MTSMRKQGLCAHNTTCMALWGEPTRCYDGLHVSLHIQLDTNHRNNIILSVATSNSAVT